VLPLEADDWYLIDAAKNEKIIKEMKRQALR
jgi:hypothetical protein